MLDRFPYAQTSTLDSDFMRETIKMLSNAGFIVTRPAGTSTEALVGVSKANSKISSRSVATLRFTRTEATFCACGGEPMEIFTPTEAFIFTLCVR